MYRINHGNGRTFGEWSALSGASTTLENQRERARTEGKPFYAFIQQEIAPGEWRRVKGWGEQ